MSEESSPLIGAVILGRYEIVSQLGAGGMGAVFKARQISMDRMVALKLLHPALSGSEPLAARFHREMQVTSRVQHPNIIQVFDYGKTDDRQLFLAMELLDGQTLGQLLRQEGPLPLPRIVHITTQVVRALGAAHQQGIVHRDLKPDNVMLLDRFGERDFVKVLDFGIARNLEADGHGEHATKMTIDGSLMGTPTYMSPEQAMGKPVGPPSDLYSLGIMLYEMCVGQPPFVADALTQLLLMHTTEPPRPPSAIAPGRVPSQMESLILELLLKEPSRRPASAAAVLERLGAGLDTPPVASQKGSTIALPQTEVQLQTPAPKRRRWQLPATVAAVAAVGLMVLGFRFLPGGKVQKGMEPARARLSTLLTADGDPPAPPSCRTVDPQHIAALLRPAELLAGASVSSARPQDREALALLLRQGDPALGKEAEYSALQARAYLALDDPGRAEDAAGKATGLCPDFALAYNLLGNAAQKARRYAAASAAYEKALSLSSGYVAPHYNLGLLFLRQKDTHAAIQAFDQVLRLRPDHPTVRVVRGQAHLLAGETTEAMTDLEEATRRQPDRSDAWLLLGEARAQAGLADAARDAFCRAKALGSTEAAKSCPR